jgi:ATP-dependent helicase/nuclease subunit B
MQHLCYNYQYLKDIESWWHTVLHFILGRAGSGKTYTLRTALKGMAETTSKKLMLIVPEQSSFENERAMLQLLGEKNIQRVSVTSFSRLTDAVYRTYGGGAGRRLDDGGRSIFMSLALEQVKDNLNFYRKNADSTELVDLLLSTSAELKMCNISPFDIENTAHELKQSTLKQKMTEISLILSSYDALVGQSYIDPLDDLTRIKNILEVHKFFEGYTVALDSFQSFTVQEYNIINLILAQSDDLYVSLCADKLDDPEHGMGLFSLVRRTAKNLKHLAKNNDVKIASPIVLNSSVRFKSSSLCAIEENAYRFNHKSVSCENNDVVIYEAQNKYDESEYVSATIRNLIINEGYRYRDFAVISRSPDSYRGILDSALERWEIPYFMDKPQSIDFEPIMRLVLSAFKIVQTGFSSDSIFTYLKTGLTGLNTYEISQLENYIFTWKISGAKWKSEWTENPRGFSDKMTENESNVLKEINESRNKVIRPLIKFTSKIQNATGEEIAAASFELLQDIEAPKHLRELAKRLENCGEPELADRQLRLWDLLMSILDQTALVLAANKIKYTRYAELLHIVILANNMASIPQGLDEVTVGAADRTKTGEPKIVFIIGTVQGEFPLSPSGSCIFSDSERRELIKLGLPLNDTLEGVAVQERFLAYKAMSSASEKLFVTYPISGLEGEANSPSSIPNEACSILKNIDVMNRFTLTQTYFANAKEPCFELMSQQWKHNTPLSATLKSIFYEHENYRVNSIERSAKNVPKVFEDSGKARDLFGNDLKLSATQIEKFYLCPFQYFCRFGLNVKERKAAEMDALEYGSLMHYLLEKILRKYSSKKINDMEPQELKDEIIKLLNEYLNIKMGGEENRTPRFLYLFKRIAESAYIIISHIAQELCQSKFEPVDFELPIGMGEIKPLIINLPNGGKAEINGKIDRIDVVNLDNEKYVRVVDYKTGHRDFKLSDIIYGINMQMLIYLAALIENGNEKYGNIKPAGVLYMPANRPDVSVSKSETEEKIRKEAEKKLKMDGLVLDDAEVIFAMEEGGKGRYIPVILKDGVPSKREHVATSEELKILKKYIKSLISDMAELLHSGNVEALPLSGEYNACDWCPYSAVCGHEKDDKTREMIKLDRDKVMEELQLNNGKGGEER